jgi:hypothetical protein
LRDTIKHALSYITDAAQRKENQMILVACTDDPNLVTIARTCSQQNRAIFGMYYQIFKDELPKLGQNEDLFIISHGAYKGDDNNPVIGDKDKKREFYLNAVDLYLNIKDIIPHSYKGRVYIDACEAAQNDENTFSFIEVFYAQINPGRNTKVYGRNGTVSGLIPLPDASGWRQA